MIQVSQGSLDGIAQDDFLAFVEPLLVGAGAGPEPASVLNQGLMFWMMGLLADDEEVETMIDKLLMEAEPDDTGCAQLVDTARMMVARHRAMFPDLPRRGRVER